jgi:hypothetical protein
MRRGFVKVFAKGRTVRRVPGTMNKTEHAYMTDVLAARMLAGEIVNWWFEGVTLKLAKDTRYTPDFLVMLSDGTLECHEVKGFMRDDANVKLKVAAQMFPLKFVLVKKDKEGWHITEV